MKNPFPGALKQAKRAAAQVVVLVPEKVRHEAAPSVSSSQAQGPFRGHSEAASVQDQESEQGRSAGVMESAPDAGRAALEGCMACHGPLEIPEGVIAIRICKRCVDGGFRVAGAVTRFAGWLDKLTK